MSELTFFCSIPGHENIAENSSVRMGGTKDKIISS